MGKQSSRLYYNGKDHKDIYYNGKYHNAMYFKDQGGLIWQKLMDLNTLGGCLINTKYGVNDMGINFLEPASPKLDATVVKQSSDDTFLNIISGKNRAFGIRLTNAISNHIWVTQNGFYWSKIVLSNMYKRVYPCFNGFVYVDSNNNVYRIILDDNNKMVSETLIYEGFNTYYDNTYGNELYQLLPRQSNNGIWTKYGNKIQFLTYNGVLLEYDFESIAKSLTIAFTFNTESKTYAYVNASIWLEEYQDYAMGCIILSCDEKEIKVEKITGAEYEWIQDAKYAIAKDNNFYFYFGGATWLTIKKTSNFTDVTTVAEWGEEDYIELNLIGGSTDPNSSNVNSTGINTVRLYPQVEYQQTLRESYSRDGNVAVIRKYDLRSKDYAPFVNEMLTDYGAFYQVGGNLPYMSTLAIWLDSPIITKETKGFAYFTDNIGVGVSYP